MRRIIFTVILSLFTFQACGNVSDGFQSEPLPDTLDSQMIADAMPPTPDTENRGELLPEDTLAGTGGAGGSGGENTSGMGGVLNAGGAIGGSANLPLPSFAEVVSKLTRIPPYVVYIGQQTPGNTPYIRFSSLTPAIGKDCEYNFTLGYFSSFLWEAEINPTTSKWEERSGGRHIPVSPLTKDEILSRMIKMEEIPSNWESMRNGGSIVMVQPISLTQWIQNHASSLGGKSGDELRSTLEKILDEAEQISPSMYCR